MERTQEQGSAKSLNGLVYCLSIFISDSTNRWGEQDKLEVLSKTRSAERWLADQGSRYGVSLSFHRGGCFGLSSDVNVDFIPSARGTRHEYTEWVAYVLHRIGWRFPVDLYNHIAAETDANSIHVLLHANTLGISYSLPFVSGGNVTKHFLEGCMMYRYYPGGEKLCAASIAHEILHLYGAWDLYATFAVSVEQAKMGELWFPNDVMRRISYNINEVEVGPLTAWRIGWAARRESWYEWFKPQDG